MTQWTSDGHGSGCFCHSPVHMGRRRIGAGLGWGMLLMSSGSAGLLLPPALALAQDGIQLPKRGALDQLVPAEQLEQQAEGQYRQLLRSARDQNALAPDNHPQLKRLRSIAQRIVAHVGSPNLQGTDRARQWRWEINLIASKDLNAFCMPGGKIAFFYGLLDQLKLSDDEVAMVMGHEVAHAIREHAREQVSKKAATGLALSLGAALLGLGDAGQQAANIGTQLLGLRFSRKDESEADDVGLDLAARAGYDPRAGVSLWDKMSRAHKGEPPKWLNTHPPTQSRIQDIQNRLPLVAGVYARSAKPPQRFGPPT